VVVEEVVPETNDVYISAAANSDIVFVGGSTYIWANGTDGRRHRHFYGRGDRRQEVFHRRDNLHSVTAHRSERPAVQFVSHDTRHHPGENRRGHSAHGVENHRPVHQNPDRVAARNRLHPEEPHHPQPMQGKSPREASFQHHSVQPRHEPSV
jgi:hypothetical protein